MSVRPASNNHLVANTMKNYGVRWTDPDGTHRASAVSYDRASADDRKARLEASGAIDVDVVGTEPGELAQPKRSSTRG